MRGLGEWVSHLMTSSRAVVPACLLLLVFWAISIHNLDVVPPVYEDEPWQASTGYKLAREGVFGSDLLAGFYGMEQRYYGFMPAHPLLLALVFKTAGLGLFQDRFETVAMALLVLALTYSLALRLFKDARVGLLAVLFLISVPLNGLTRIQLTGILFLDMARIARYDMLVPVLGLASLHAYLSARTRGFRRWYLLSGALAGLSGLAHLYGVFWLPVLVLLAVWDHRERAAPSEDTAGTERAETVQALQGNRGWASSVGLLLLGFVLPWLPYAAYVLQDAQDWRGQTRVYASRFELLNLRWYLGNLLQEPHRYGPGLGPLGWGAVLRVGFWSTCVALPSSSLALLWRALRRHDQAARAVIIPLLVMPALFALLIYLKLANYTVTVAPVAAIAGAWGGVACWTWVGRGRWRRPARLALVVVLAGMIVEGASRVAALETAATTATPYDAFIQQVRGYIPPDTRVLALHNYWLGLQDHDYRSFLVPLSWMDDGQRPLSFDEGMERVAPDVVLVDARMRAYFEEADEVRVPFYDWLSRHTGRLIGQVDDPTYGLMEIYRVGAPPGAVDRP